MVFAGRTCGIALCATAGLLTLAAPALASDLLPMPGTAWGGFYVGGQLGGAWSDTDWRYDNHNWFNTIGPALVGTNFDIDVSGIIGGGQAGFNYQSGSWVLGVETSVAGADLDGSRNDPFFPGSGTYSADIDLLTTVTGRIGYAQGKWLAYAKGGWAGADVELALFDRETPVRANSSDWANGWTVGGGGEYAICKNLSLGVEYDFAELDKDRWKINCPTCPSGVGGGVPVVDGDIQVQSVTARLNHRFGG
jgi:outer membrane immunogenic protein